MKHRIWLILWITLACVVCLLPGPDWVADRLWDDDSSVKGEEGPAVEASSESDLFQQNVRMKAYAFFTENLHIKGQLGHFIPMVGIGFCLGLLFRSRGVRITITICLAVISAGAIAITIEMLQGLLPRYFGRGFSWADIEVALVGGLFGVVGAALDRRAGASSRGAD